MKFETILPILFLYVNVNMWAINLSVFVYYSHRTQSMFVLNMESIEDDWDSDGERARAREYIIKYFIYSRRSIFKENVNWLP